MSVGTTTTRLRHAGRWPWAVPVLMLALVPLVGNIGGASIPDGAGEIHACYDDDGLLRVIDTAGVTGSCKALETPLTWSRTGPAGTNGADGISGYVRVNGDPITDSNDFKEVTAECPAETRAFGGGFFSSVESPDDDVAIVASFPLTDDVWQVIGVEQAPITADWTLEAFVVCAIALP